MVEVGNDSACSSCAELESKVRTALAILGTNEHVEVVILGNVELIVQGICCSPAPTCTNLVCGRLVGALVTLVVEVICTEEVTPCPCVLLVAHLSTIDKTLDRLDFNIAHNIEVVIYALVVCTLVLYQRCERVGSVRCIVEETSALQVIITEEFAIIIINRYKRVGTEHGRKLVGILAAIVETLLLAVPIVEVLTHLDYVHTLGVTQDNVLRVQTQCEAAEVRLCIVATEYTILILIAKTH